MGIDNTDEGLKARLRHRLKSEEGRKNVPYKDSKGYWTAGIGHLLSPAEKEKWYGKQIPDALIDEWFDNDISGCFPDLDKTLPWWRHEVAPRQLVLLDMCFNLGIGRLLGFKNTLRNWRDGDYDLAAQGLAASLWDSQIGKRADRLEDIVRTGLDDLYSYA